MEYPELRDSQDQTQEIGSPLDSGAHLADPPPVVGGMTPSATTHRRSGAIVVGADPAGLAPAKLRTHRGQRVLLEAGKTGASRARTFKFDGPHLDLGPLALHRGGPRRP